MVKQILRNRETDDLMKIMDELETTSISSFPMLFGFKKEDADKIVQLGEYVAECHHEYMTNPENGIMFENRKKFMKKYKKK